MIKKPRQTQKYNPGLEIWEKFQNLWPCFWPLGVHYRAYFQVSRGGWLSQTLRKKVTRIRWAVVCRMVKRPENVLKMRFGYFVDNDLLFDPTFKELQNMFLAPQIRKNSPWRSRRRDLQNFKFQHKILNNKETKWKQNIYFIFLNN